MAFPGRSGDLPVWATTPIADEHLGLCNSYATAPDWPAEKLVLTARREVFLSAGFRAALDAVTGLDPDNPTAGMLAELLDEIAASDVDTVFTRHQAHFDRRSLTRAWTATPNWDESRAFLAEHRAELCADPVLGLLAAGDDRTDLQHAAILTLLDTRDSDAVYAIVTDVVHAESAVFEALESGELPDLGAILTAAPHLAERPSTRWLAAAALALARGHQRQACDFARAAAESADDRMHRRAHTARLCALARSRPDLEGLDDLIALLDPRTSTGES